VLLRRLADGVDRREGVFGGERSGHFPL
jgi:hypothetical protein